MSLDQHGQLHDETNGLADLEKRIIRFIGDPETRIREDALRILRLFRFHAFYGEGTLDKEAFAACLRQREQLAILSRERVHGELFKLLVAPGACEVAHAHERWRVSPPLFKGIVHFGRLRNLAEAESAYGFKPDPAMHLAALAVFKREDCTRLTDILRLSRQEQRVLETYGALEQTLRRHPLPMRALAAEHGSAIRALFAWQGEPWLVLGAPDKALLVSFLKGDPARSFVKSLRFHEARHQGRAPDGEVLNHARSLWLSGNCPMDEASLAAITRKALDQAS